MLIKGSFIDITNTNKYYIEIGTLQTGETPIIIKNADEYDHTDTESIFFGAEPVIVNSDLSDTFEHVYIRSCSITLTCNFDIRNIGIVAKNYTDIKVKIQANDNQGDIIFSGFVSPLTFNQTYGYNYNEFTLECVDKLGILEYIKVPDIITTPIFNYGDYNTPRYFINAMLSQCGFTGINYDIEYDHTEDTKINPAIFVGESEDDWMDCKEALNEIGKLYGCYFWQNGDECYVENILLYDLTSPQTVNTNEYTAADTNISVDNAYNNIKCTVDISSMEDTFLDPFDDENIELQEQYSERVFTELLFKNKGNKFENLENIKYLYSEAYGDPYSPYASPIINWYDVQNTLVENENFEVYDNYAQVIKNKMLDFHSEDHTDIQGDPTYLDFTTWDDSDEGEHSKWSRASNTLKWLYNHPGRGAFIAFGKTNNLTNWKNRERPQLKDMKNYLLIQLNWARTDADYGGSGLTETQRRQNIYNKIGEKLSDASPVCSFTMNESKNLVPSDASTVNYLVFSGKIRLNPIVARTGPNASSGDFEWDNYKVWSFWERGSRNNILTSLVYWQAAWRDLYKGFPKLLLKGRCVYKDDNDDGTYYNTCGWNNRRGGWDPDSGISYGIWPYNAKGPDWQNRMAFPYLSPNYELWKYEHSSYDRKGNEQAVDKIEKLAILACELKIGNKYLIENLDKLDQATWSMGYNVYNEVYTWVDENELPMKDGVPQTWFTIGINPGIGDNIVGKDFDIQNTVDIFMNLDAKGLAIPMRYSDNLHGPVTFRILGPYNLIYLNKKCVHYWEPFRRVATTVNEGIPLLAYLENILISDFKIELKSVNVNGASQQNTDNDLVYTSQTNTQYLDEQEFECKFCTSLSSQEVVELEVDYNLNNSCIVNSNDESPWTGMMTYEGETARDQNHKIKLEACRVTEQYNLWKRPRNLIQTSLTLKDPEKAYDKNNYTFDYLKYNNNSLQIYRTFGRELDLRGNTMTVTMKELSEIPN